MVVPISEASAEYAQEVRKTLRNAHFFVDVDLADNKMQKKVREAQLAQYNYILVRLFGHWSSDIFSCSKDPSSAHVLHVKLASRTEMHGCISTELSCILLDGLCCCDVVTAWLMRIHR